MSNNFEGRGDLGPPPPPFRPGSPQRQQGGRGWIVISSAVLLVLVVGGALRGLYTDWLWFESLGYTQVFSVFISTRVALFAGAAVVFFLFFMINMAMARAIAPKPVIAALSGEQGQLASRLTWTGLFGAGLVGAIIAGSIASGEWSRVLAFVHGEPFGQTEPVFNMDLGFFVFTLPVLRFGQVFGTGIATVTLAGAVVVYGFALSLSAAQPFGRASAGRSRAVRAHVSLLGAIIFGGLALGYGIDRLDLMFSESGAVFGPGYTDINARLPALTVQAAVAATGALVLLANIWLRGIGLPALAVAGLVITSIVGGRIYPEFVQRFQVEPNELARERPFIEQNIAFTRRAFGLDRIEEVRFPGEEQPPSSDILANLETINNIRLWDHEPLLATYEQIQAIRRYYQFHDVDIDRYNIQGSYRQVMIAARELAPDKLALAGEAPTWVNQRLKFTHGYGVTLSPVNEISPEGLPNLYLKDLPPQSPPGIRDLAVTRPEIYFGEKTDTWVIVNSEEPELDYASETEIKYTNYQGKGGVPLDSTLRKALFAWQMNDPNILLTSLNPDSRILYYRTVQQRVQKIAPFLMLDSDPYVVIADGRLVYVQDAYTVSNRYPYSERNKGRFNYIRNSVKAVVDAYDGTVEFYNADPSDPIIAAFGKVYPGLLKPMSDMPASLRAHLRYPEDLFNVQAEMYQTYHMQDPQVFYNKEDAFARPIEVYLDKEREMEAYYVIMRLPSQSRPEFMLILPFTPVNKNNANAWLAGRSDGEHYGKLLAFVFPKERLIYGPRQIEARIDQNPTISQQFALWNQSGARVLRGNLLFVPIGDSYIYVEPIYLQSRESQLPELARVVVAAGNRIAMESTLEEALNRIYGSTILRPIPSQAGLPTRQPEGAAAGAAPGGPSPTPSPTPAPAAGTPPAPTTPGAPASTDMAVLAKQANDHFNNAQEALRKGDWANYGSELQRMEQVLKRMVELAQPRT